MVRNGAASCQHSRIDTPLTADMEVRWSLLGVDKNATATLSIVRAEYRIGYMANDSPRRDFCISVLIPEAVQVYIILK